MRRKEKWMYRGGIVIADGHKGVITSFQENTLRGVEYVYSIRVRLNGERTPRIYHPDDVQEPTRLNQLL